jgi:hypothetical protein
VEGAPESFELDNLGSAPDDTLSAMSTPSRTLMKNAQKLRKLRPNDTASDSAGTLNVQSVSPGLRFAALERETLANRRPKHRDVKAMACDVSLYAEVAWEQLARIMNSSAGASYYLSDCKWADTWYAELERDQSKLERQGLRDIIIRPGTALMASPASPEDCRYRHFLLPNFINLQIAAGNRRGLFLYCMVNGCRLSLDKYASCAGLSSFPFERPDVWVSCRRLLCCDL